MSYIACGTRYPTRLQAIRGLVGDWMTTADDDEWLASQDAEALVAEIEQSEWVDLYDPDLPQDPWAESATTENDAATHDELVEAMTWHIEQARARLA